MINKDNLKDMLKELGFESASSSLSDKCYQKKFGTCVVAVDFDNKRILYPEKNGLKVNDKTTSNFEHDENFVVLECVCRLLEKGYRPDHIELEPRWTLGHEAKGGKADILVKNDKGEPLIIFECKTFGTEFKKERKKHRSGWRTVV